MKTSIISPGRGIYAFKGSAENIYCPQRFRLTPAISGEVILRAAPLGSVRVGK